MYKKASFIYRFVLHHEKLISIFMKVLMFAVRSKRKQIIDLQSIFCLLNDQDKRP